MNSESAHRKGKVFIVDDHPLVREGLTTLIEQQSDLTVCGESETAPEAFAAIGVTKPEVAIVDISLKDSSGIELIKNLKESYPEVAVLVLSMHEEFHYAERALRAGARGYVMKRETTKEVVDAIRRIREGKMYLSAPLSEAMAIQFVEGKKLVTGSPVEQLSDRELEVFDMLGQGLGTRQIAEALRISLKTVQAYCARMKEKLNLRSGSELLREAIRWNDNRHPR
jgi:DNA-binding NarL/FixJ family response regulator